MKPVAHKSRPKEWIPLSNFAMVDAIPTSLVLNDHLLPFEGAKEDPKFLWGIYGTSSMTQMLFMADAFARRQKKTALTVQLWYHVDNFDNVKSKITDGIANEAGFIHLDRLQSNFRDSLKDHVLMNLRKVLGGGAQFVTLQSMSLDDIMVRHPEAVRFIFADMPKVNVVVHPVRQMYDESVKKPVMVATVRNVKKRLMAMEVRYLEEIQVTSK